MVLLGLVTLPLMLITVVVTAVLLIRLRQGRSSGPFQRIVLAGVAGLHVVFWLGRWVLMQRLRRALASVGDEPGG